MMERLDYRLFRDRHGSLIAEIRNFPGLDAVATLQQIKLMIEDLESIVMRIEEQATNDE